MSTVIEFLKSNALCTLCLILGIVALLITYVGAPIASKKSGKYVSGLPCVGGILIALGFLTTPVKWLALFGLIDISIPLFLVKGLPSVIKSKLDAFNGSAPRMIGGNRVVAYTTYYNRYSEHKEIIDEETGAFKLIPIERLAVTETDNGFKLLELDYQFNVITEALYSSVEECKRHASPKSYNRWIDVNR